VADLGEAFLVVLEEDDATFALAVR